MREMKGREKKKTEGVHVGLGGGRRERNNTCTHSALFPVVRKKWTKVEEEEEEDQEVKEEARIECFKTAEEKG